MNIFKSKKPVGEEKDGIEGERTTSSVNKGASAQAKITNRVIIVAVIVIVSVLLFQYYADLIRKSREADDAAKPDTSRTIATNLPPLRPAFVLEPTPQAAPPAPNIAPQAAPPVGPNGQPQLSPAEIAQQRRLKSSIFFAAASSPAGGAGAANNAGQSGAGAVAGNGDAAQDTAGSDALNRSLQPTRTAGASAHMLADPSLTITKGSVIPCTVIPAVDSTLAGIVTCIQSADVWSADGKVLLLERGTKWVGEQKTGLAQGQKRLGMLWTRGQTPNHVLIDVDSGTADALGRPGVSGVVDTHFWDRFSGAILVSLIGDLGSFLTATQSGGSGNTAIAFPGTVTGAQTAMSDIIRSTINIPPTLTKNQGASISIYVARDLDFRGVYALEAKQ